MKVQELMIGNYLKFNTHTVKVVEIKRKHCMVEFIDKELQPNFIIIAIEDLEPIKINYEWLNGFGCFNKETDISEGGIVAYRYVYSNYINLTAFTFTSNWDFEEETYVNYNEGGIYVYYIHKLQNLYLAAICEELTTSENVK